MVETALELASQGFHVFPLKEKTKVAAVLKWPEIATQDPTWIKAMWGKAGANANIGILMGNRAGLVGLDIDVDDGADLAFFEMIPPSWTVRSAKGYHVFYKIPDDWPKDIGKIVLAQGGGGKPCVTLRGNNHYFCAVGSIHPETGGEYRWATNSGLWVGVKCDELSPYEIPCAMAPDWFLTLREKHEFSEDDRIGTNGSGQRPASRKTPSGLRHDMFMRTAVAMRLHGKTSEEIRVRLTYRNREDCEKPKPDCDSEIAGIARWAEAHVIPDPKKVAEAATKGETAAYDIFPENVKCLGYKDCDYYYITKFNKALTKLTNHSWQSLIRLAPKQFWAELFPTEKGIDWISAASYTVHKSNSIGIFTPTKVRGVGAWNDNSRLVLHLGDRLLCDGKEMDLLAFGGENFYRLGKKLQLPTAQAATTEECQSLVEACKAPRWKNPGSAILLAGQLALVRISGALPWRSHAWFTSPTGGGKTTFLTTVVYTMTGPWKISPKGNSTEAGIRQKLECDSLPVIYDEAEAENRNGSRRMKAILELIRQSSSEDEGSVLKGTPDGRGLEFKINSMFILSSIHVSLEEAADLNRFAIYEILMPEKGSSAFEFQRKLQVVTPELADKIFRRAINNFPTVLENYKILQQKIAALSTNRTGQQYGILLAGYALLIKDGVLSEREADELISQIELNDRVAESSESTNEGNCLDRLLSWQLKFASTDLSLPTDTPIQTILDLAIHNSSIANRIEKYGLKIRKEGVAIANRHALLEPIFANTPWEGKWKQALSRLPGALLGRTEFNGGNAKQSVIIPIAALNSEKSNEEPLPDDGIG